MTEIDEIVKEIEEICVFSSDGKIVGYHRVPPLELMARILHYLTELSK